MLCSKTSTTRFSRALFTISLSMLSGCQTAQITFTGITPTKYINDSQPLTIYACNNTTIKSSMRWKKRVVRKIPYGWQTKNGKRFYLSKYYIASPPVPNSFAVGKPLTLGVLSIDSFSILNAGENVNVFMDYKKLKPIELKDIAVNYSANADGEDSCLDKNVNEVPINIRCPSFEYTNNQGIGLGKGIALLSRITDGKKLTHLGKLFIPTNIQTKHPLEKCTVEILNDIILDQEVFFETNSGPKEKIDLTEAYHAYNNNDQEVYLSCRTREEGEIPTGCLPSKD